MTPEPKDVAGLLPSSEGAVTWLPTPANINALPDHVRGYIHDLVANCDPAGMVRENAMLRDTNAGLQKMYRAAADALTEVHGCFEMAESEGLSTALAETTDERLKDLVERRLMYAEGFAAPGAAIAAREQEAGLTGQLATAVEAIEARHDPFCMSVLRGKACDCGLASRQEAPVASGEPTDIPSAKAEDRTLTNAERSMLVFLFSQMSDLSDTEWRQHGFRRSTFENLERKLAASPSGAGLGGAVASSEAGK